MRNAVLILALVLTTCVLTWAQPWRYEDKQGNKIVVEHPGIPGPPAFARAFEDRFIPKVDELLDPESVLDYETTVKSGLKTARYHSLAAQGLIVYRDHKGDVLGAHPTKVFQVLTWDLKRQEPVSLKALIHPGKTRQLFALLRKYAEFPDAIDPNWGLEFYLRTDGVAFYQPQAPFAAFGLEFLVPYRELKPLAAPGSPLLDAAVTGKL